MQLFQVTTDYFCCGLVTEGDVVVDAAPIMSWAKGKCRVEIRQWVARRKGTIKYVCTLEEP
jgi:hypothetical protein